MITETIIQESLKKQIPDIQPGDTIRVHQKLKEGPKERIQVFEGMVIARKHGSGINATITVRKISQNVAVERIFPIHAPFIEKIEIMKRSKVRRAKLYFLRQVTGKKARLKAKALGVAVEEPLPAKEERGPEVRQPNAESAPAEATAEQAEEPAKETAEETPTPEKK